MLKNIQKYRKKMLFKLFYSGEKHKSRKVFETRLFGIEKLNFIISARLIRGDLKHRKLNPFFSFEVKA